ncbi:TonB-dependent receptor [bacterium]|nr:TonB-dependent receptor [bacterium]
MKFRHRLFNHRLLPLLILLFSLVGGLHGQTTGKISGIIRDNASGDALPGANINLVGTNRGAAADAEGRYYILNISPGFYNMRVDMIGYAPVIVENIAVSVNRTIPIDVRMVTSVIEGQVVIIEVDRMAMKKDQTSTIKNISAEQLEMLPVENLSAVVNMQAGVVEGHFRGGRNTEVSYMIDGITVDESFGGTSAAVDIEPESIKDLEVITGTFNAEYGRSMSGIVNAVTKDGEKEFHGSFYAGMANYYSTHDSIFLGIDSFAVNKNEDYKFQLSGPVLDDRITFFMNARWQNNRNHLNAIHLFNVSDYSNYFSEDSDEWISISTGTGKYVPMNGSENKSFLGKMVFNLYDGIKFSLMHSINQDRWDGYDHAFKYNPYGQASSYRRSDFSVFQLNHMLSNNLFYEAKISLMETFNGGYVFKDTVDARYVNDVYASNYGSGFFTGGQQKEHNSRWLTDFSSKVDMTWQINNNHSVKTGLALLQHDLTNEWYSIRNRFEGTELAPSQYDPVTFGDSSVYADVYSVKPVDFSAYIQDKMEYDEMVINYGIRYDWFDPATVYPSNLRNPANQLNFGGDSISTYPSTPVAMQVSPRIGLAYQLGEAAILHFSYGHFFQLPPMFAMYRNHSFLIGPSDYGTIVGNSNLEAEKTVAYEVGLWQELSEGMGIEVSLFYKDIYNLLSGRVISTYNQVEYGFFTNLDYGNVRGFEVKYDVLMGPLSFYLNYTLQYTRGNSDSPYQSFDREGNSQDPVNKLIPMSWDQRHTINGTLGYSGDGYGISMTGYFNSGAPYTFFPQGESILGNINLYPNNAYRPIRYHADMSAFYELKLIGDTKLRFDLSVYNILDRLNENWVNGETGRAYTAIIDESDIANFKSDFSKYYETYQDPSAFSAPRQIKLGMGIKF